MILFSGYEQIIMVYNKLGFLYLHYIPKFVLKYKSHTFACTYFEVLKNSYKSLVVVKT
jgi:hypothetical protein